MPAVDLQNRGGIAVLQFAEDATFCDKVRNAFSDALDQVAEDESYRALLITGSGKNFNQGLNLEYLGSVSGEEAIAHVQLCMAAVKKMLCMGLPVVSAVNGHAFGLGAMLVLASDYSVMREDRGYWCLPEVDLGMSLEAAMNSLVTDKLSAKALREGLYCGRRLGGADAQALGVVDEACALEDLEDRAVELSTAMQGKQRATLSRLKTDAQAGIIAGIDANQPT